MDMEMPILILRKNVEKISHKITIPIKFIEKNGNKFYMEIYKDKIILKPVREEE